MARVLSNETALAFIRTAGVDNTANLKTASSGAWQEIERNDLTRFGPTISTVARNPVSNNRQRRQGRITDLDSSVEFSEDLTRSAARRFFPPFCFVESINSDVTDMKVTAVDATNGFTVAALTAEQAAKFPAGAITWLSGFSNDANNGLKAVSADATAGDTMIETSDTQRTEASADGRLSLTGMNLSVTGATYVETTVAGKTTAVLTKTDHGFNTLGLTEGMFIHVGTITKAGQESLTSHFTAGGSGDGYGYARVTFIDDDVIRLDKLSESLKGSTLPSTGSVTILFGEFIRNVRRDNADFSEAAFIFEASYPELGDGTNNEDAFEYSLGNYCDTASINLPLTDKATVSWGFIGIDTDPPTTTRKFNPMTNPSELPEFTAAFNTSSDIARLRVSGIDNMGDTTEFKSLTITIGNEVSPEKILGTLGAAYMNTGNFLIDITGQILFTSPGVIAAVRDNDTITMDFIIGNEDGVLIFDIPSATLGGGDREFPVNETVRVNLSGQAFQDRDLKTSIGISIIPVPIPIED